MARWVAATLRRWQLNEQLHVAAAHRQRDHAGAVVVHPDRRPDRRPSTACCTDILELTGCEYGFVGEVLTDEDGAPYLKTHAVTDIAWNDETRAWYEQYKDEGLEFDNPDTLFGRTLTSGQALLSNDPQNDPRRGTLPGGHPPLDCYLGLPGGARRHR